MGTIEECPSCPAKITDKKGERNRLVMCDGGTPTWSCDALLCEKCATRVGPSYYCEQCMKRDNVKKGAH